MKKGTIHVSMKLDQFYHDNGQLAYVVASEYLYQCIDTNKEQIHLQNNNTLYSMHTSTSYM